MSYFDFVDSINKEQVRIIFELGSRDLIDAIKLIDCFDNSIIHSFECNHDCLEVCKINFNKLNDNYKNRIFLVEKAVSISDGYINFYPFDLAKYNNMGASSLLKIDFSNRDLNDPDYNRPNPQKEVVVEGIRLDTYMNYNNIQNIDLLCIDLQGYELNAIKSLGEKIKNVKYIITETCIESTYTNGDTFKELNDYLNKHNFYYEMSNSFQKNFPDLSIKGFSEFDCLFINKNNILS